MSIWIFLRLIGSLSLLLYGIKAMSESLQKMAGPQLRSILGAMTTNRFTGLLSGMFVTASVQSSTATTVMAVSFVNAGLLTLAQAISVIMGANIGTTFTAWVMALGFTLDMESLVYPAFCVALLLIYTRRIRYVGDFIFGVAFLFLAISLLGSLGRDIDLSHNTTFIGFFGSFDSHSWLTAMGFLAAGTVLTSVIQSSAALLAFTMLLCTSGVLPVQLGMAMVLGENLGTTLSANMAARKANTQARRAAMAHLLFNAFGVVWALLLLQPFSEAVCAIAGTDTADGTGRLSVALALFHTMFNVCNTLLLMWLIPYMERLVCVMVTTGGGDDDEFRLCYIGGGSLMKTPELSVLEARKEIMLFARRIHLMFGMVRELVVSKDKGDTKRLYERIEKYENISDNMEIEIANYLSSVSDAHLSDDTKANIRSMMREISEIESIGDSCYNIARTIMRKTKGKDDFTEQQYEHLHQMMELVDDSLEQMTLMLGKRKDADEAHRSFYVENEINNYRNQLRTQNIKDINERKYTYAIGTMYMDIVGECEKLGDYVVNVVEARLGVRKLQ